MDEIPNSLGRTGNGLYTHAMFDIVPDMVVLGKGLGGGILPLSAVVVRENLNEVCKVYAMHAYIYACVHACMLACVRACVLSKLVQICVHAHHHLHYMSSTQSVYTMHV